MQLNQDWNELLPSVSQGEMVLPITEGIGILFKTSFKTVQAKQGKVRRADDNSKQRMLVEDYQPMMDGPRLTTAK